MQTEFRKTILLVEDQAIIAMSEASLLKKNGYDVVISSTGEQAIKIIEENHYINLILMDIDLGKGIDGTEAAQTILKTHELPVVFLSNHTEKEVVEKTEKITSYGYVVKNSGETVLLASIKMAFKLFEAHRRVRESELKLLESDRRFHALEKQIDDVIWTMDMNFRFTYLSPSVEKMHGYSVDEMMKLNLQDYLTSQASEKAISVIAEEIKLYLINRVEKNIVTLEIDQIKKNGTIFPTEIRARFLLDNENNPIGIIGVTRDITQRLLSEKTLRDSEKTLNLTLEGAQIGLWDQNFKTGIVNRSDHWATMLGYDPEEMKNNLDFWKSNIHPDDLEKTLIEAKKHEQGLTEFYKVQHRLKCKNGNYKWVLNWGKISERDSDGNPVRALGIHIDVDDNIKAEEALIISENKLSSIFKAAPVGIGVTSSRVLLEVNDTMCKMLGYKGEELIGKNARILYPSDEEFELVGREKYKQIEQFGTGTVETKWVCKDGRIIDVLLSSTPLNLKEISRGVTFTVLDITGRKKFEDALRKSQERYALAQRSANIGSWEWNILTGEVSWSETIEPMFGFGKGEFKGTYEAYLKCIHPEDVGFMVEHLNAAIYRSEEYSNLEMRIIWPNGTIKWMLANGSVFRDIDGKPNRMIGIVQDITERKIAEEKLRQSEENYRRFFEEDLSGVFLSTPEGGLKACNKAYVDMMEFESIDELIHSNPVSHYQQSQERIDFLDLLRKEKKLTNYEGKVVTKTGRALDTLENIIGVFDDQDNLVEFWGYVNDITDRKNSEQILKNAALEKEALHRELLHRVKNSFNLIKSLMYLEREKLKDSEARKVLENLEMRIGALANMYSLLNASGASQQIDLGEYLRQITNSVAESYIGDVDRIEIKLSFNKIETSPKIASSVGLIVNEILTNSLKYAFPDNKKGIIFISLKKINGNAEIEITDNGVGVSDNFNINDAKGMGLQLINMLTQQLSGTLTVEANNGTRFKILFPLEQ
ncbi:MAG: PAS domain S-box protein [Ignavibacteriales bacterium]|nr:PAS domain S-box protein [Ignavibacteriales bacterium]